MNSQQTVGYALADHDMIFQNPNANIGDMDLGCGSGVNLEDSGVPLNIKRNINIEQLDFGFVVKIGCHSFAISKSEDVIAGLSEYLADPNGTEKKWFANKLEKYPRK